MDKPATLRPDNDLIPSTLQHPGALRFWLALLLTAVATGIGAAILTRLLELVQHLAWHGSGTNIIEAARQASPWRHIFVLLGAALLTGAGQILLKQLSSGNGIDTTEAIWFHAGRMPSMRTLGKRGAVSAHRRDGCLPGPRGGTEASWSSIRKFLFR